MPKCRVGGKCHIESKGIDLENKRVPVVLSDESDVVRHSWNDGMYYLKLIHNDESIDLERAEILSLFINHNTYELPIGRFENVRIEDSKLKAEAIFDEDDEASMKIFKKLSKGFLQSFSVGIDIHEKTLTKEVDGIKYYDVTKWSIHEASVVGIPAIPTAKVGMEHELVVIPTADSDKLAKLNQRNEMEFNKDNFGKLETQVSDLRAELAKEKLKADESVKTATTTEATRLKSVIESVGLSALSVEGVATVVFTAGATTTDVEAAMFRHEKSQKEKMSKGIEADGKKLAIAIEDVGGAGGDGEELTAGQKAHAMAMKKTGKGTK